MLCPKCGTEYEGRACPVCSKPEIVVNNADYLKRKKAYEEKQAASKSASSDTTNRHEKQPKEKQQTVTQDKVRRFLQNGVSFATQKATQTKERIGKVRGTDIQTKETDTASDMKKLASIRKKGIPKKKIVIGIIGLLIILAAVGVYRLAIRKNYEMYMVSENGIYNVSSLESHMVCETNDAAFAADNRTFYRVTYPQEIDKNQVIDITVSADGKYFAAVTYDEMNHTYVLYIWNKNGVVEVAGSTKRKDIKYLSNQGKLIYTDMTENQSRDATTNTAESNVAGGVSNVTLYVYEVTESGEQMQGVQHLVDNNILSVHIYAQKNMLICLNGDNSLYLYNYEKLSDKTGIADDVSGIYAMSEDTENLYTYNAAEVNLKKSAAGFVYTIGQNCFFHEITEKETMKTIDSKNTSDLVLAKASGSSMQVIYEKSNNLVYIMNSGKIAYAKIEDKKVGKFEEVAAFGAMTTGLYYPDAYSYLFIDDQNRLVSLKKGETHVLIEDVTDGTLYEVENTNTAFTYVKSGKRYYRTDFSGNDVELINVADGYASGKIIWYKNNLYFYKEDGKLYTCTQKGKNLTEVGDVERFFLGTEYH